MMFDPPPSPKRRHTPDMTIPEIDVDYFVTNKERMDDAESILDVIPQNTFVTVRVRKIRQ